jgi:hypothetical protein
MTSNRPTGRAYAVPIAIVNPYLAGGLFVDYMVRGRYHLIPKDLKKLPPDDPDALTSATVAAENPLSASVQVHSAAAASGEADVPSAAKANSGLKEVMATHE